MSPRSGLAEGVPYSLSRWTDLPAAKWPWFKTALVKGSFQAFDPRIGIPDWWSLRPEETHSLVFWTKDPRPLVQDYPLLQPYRIEAHVTITGWVEVEHGAPDTEAVCDALCQLADKIGKENVFWRFSPVPLLATEELLRRFERIYRRVSAHTARVYLSFLQPNDRVPETRLPEEQVRIMRSLASVAGTLPVLLCNESRALSGVPGLPSNLRNGVCAPPRDPMKSACEPCGCVIMVDPFTMNETCSMGCEFCYAADVSLSAKKRNTTKLRVIR